MLRTIGNNFANAAKSGKDLEYQVGGTTKSLSLMDSATGDMKSTFQIFKELKNDWDNMTNSEKQNLAITYAGKNQFEVFSAVMNNFKTALDATTTAYNSSGSAARENAAYMESLEAKINLLKAAFEEFANRVITSEFLGAVLDAGTRLLEFANTDIGTTIIQMGLLGGSITGVVGLIGTFGSAIADAIGKFKAIKSVTSNVSDIIGLLGKAKWTIIAVGAGAVAIAIMGIVKAIKAWNDAHLPENQLAKFEEHKQKAEEYETELENAKARLDELNKIPYEDRTGEINAEIEQLKQLIAQYDELARKEEKAATKTTGDIARHGVRTGLSANFVDPITGMTGLPSLVEKIGTNFSTLDSMIRAYAETAGVSVAGKSTQELQRELGSLGYSFGYVTTQLSEAADMFQDYADSLNSTIVPSQTALTQTKLMLDANKADAQLLYERMEAGEQLNAEESAWLTTYWNLTQAYERAAAAAERYAKANEAISNALASIPEHIQNTTSGLYMAAQALADAGFTADDAREALLQYAQDNGLQWTQAQIDATINKLRELGKIDIDDKEVDIEADISDVEDAAQEVSELMDSLSGQGFDVSSPEGLEGLKDGLSEVLDLIGAINDTPITIQMDTSDASVQISILAEEIVALGDNQIEFALNTDQITQAQTLLATIQAIPQYRNIQINVIGDGAIEVCAAVQSAIDGVAQTNVPQITVTDNASGTLQGIIGLIGAINSKTVVITTIHRTIEIGGGGGGGARATGTKYHGGGETLINDGAPVNGSRAELVVSDGVGRIYDEGETTIQDIPRGAKIYTAAQTQKILKDRGLSVQDVSDSPIPAMADGNVSSVRSKYTDYRNNPAYSGVTTLSGSGETLEKNFKDWLDEKKHWLELDLITEAQYYRDLEIMNERYLKNLSEAKDDYWKHEEEIYKYQNQALEKQLDLEEKLSDLAKAKEQRVLVYSGGKFQYAQNLEAIAAAQREVDKLQGKYADGTTSARGGLSLVGEQGAELRVLNQGDGIIPADATKNLMSLSKFNAKDLLSGIGKAVVTNYSFDISRLELPNVSNAADFLDGLKNLAYQYSYSRA